ncbi:MAG: tRNA (adenosine(37)-N6)-threonylcarbamoyltransferase complex dimerization subunit type 1 TsaB [Alphaproteobacteria bacterium]|nr:tRNA (adenosine(37)-N6)-threonylcarbamoyltransferase complex dimerization subunit type 1 TsaB [Alphaproteobacteria bacterium]
MSAQSVITLALDSSAGMASVAVARGGDVLAQARHEAAHGHAAWIITLARDALTQASVGFGDIGVIVAGRGPGSFTGIRVALAAAKGLGLSLGLAPVGLSSLAAMARHDADGQSPVISVIDSRRKSLYFQAFSPDGEALGDVQDGQADDLVELSQTLMANTLMSNTLMVKSQTEGHHLVINGHDADTLAQRLTGEGLPARPGAAFAPLAADLCRYHHAFPAVNDGLEPLYLAPPLISTPKSS